MTALQADIPDPIGSVIERYQGIESYQVTMTSSNRRGSEIIHYHYKRPGFVRMEMVKPHKGVVLIYSPTTKEVRLWPFGAFKLPVLTLSPDSPLIQSSTGHRVDRSDVGALLNNVKTLQAQGTTQTLGEEAISGYFTLHVAVLSRGDFLVENVRRYDLWLEHATLFPVKAVSHDRYHRWIETVVMEGLRINPEFPERFFDP